MEQQVASARVASARAAAQLGYRCRLHLVFMVFLGAKKILKIISVSSKRVKCVTPSAFQVFVSISSIVDELINNFQVWATPPKS